jgi:hypothetical protein
MPTMLGDLKERQISLIQRREILGGMALLASGGCAHRTATRAPQPISGLRIPQLMPIRARTDRIFRVTVCLRPFRAAGPRLDVRKGRR